MLPTYLKLGPSAFNLQHSNYVVVNDPSIKEKIRVAANGQYKVLSASAVLPQQYEQYREQIERKLLRLK